MKRIMISLLILSAGFLCNAQYDKTTLELIKLAKLYEYNAETDTSKDEIEAYKWFTSGINLFFLAPDSSNKCFLNSMVINDNIGSYKNVIYGALPVAYYASRIKNEKSALNLYALCEKEASKRNDNAILKVVLEKWQELLLKMGETSKRKRVLKKLASLEDACNGSMDKIDYCLALGDDEFIKGNYLLAENYYRKAQKKLYSIGDDEKAVVALQLYSAIMNLCFIENDDECAIEYAEKCQKIIRQFGLHESYMMDYYSIKAKTYSSHLDTTNAVLYLDSLINLECTNEIYLIRQVETMCYCLSYISKFSIIINYLDTVDSIIIAEKGNDCRLRVIALERKGTLLKYLHKYKESIEVYSECLRILAMAYGKENQDYINVLEGKLIASVNSLIGNILENKKVFINDYYELVELIREKMRNEMGSLIMSERASYLQNLEFYEHLALLYNIAGIPSLGYYLGLSKTQLDNLYNVALEAMILSQALLLESDVSLRGLIEQQGTKQDRKLLQRIMDIEVEKKTLGDVNDSNIDTLVQLNKEQKKCQQKLCANFRKYSKHIDFMDITADDVIKAMPKNSILINFEVGGVFSKNAVCAFITKKNDRKTKFVDFVFSLSNEVINKLDSMEKGNSNKLLLDLIWNPICLNVDTTGVRTIYYVPAGGLHQMSLESLTDRDGKLLGDKYNFVRLTSARELVKKREKNHKPKTAVLYGGLQYDVNADTMIAQSRKYTPNLLIAENTRGLKRDSVFEYLFGSKEEVNSVESELSSAKVMVTKYSEVEGNEESFINLNGNAPDILHVATHGYYYTPDEASSKDYLKGYTDAMMLSGLVMSGGNAAVTGNLLEGVRDGLLTAADISAMNLKGTDLVVLSACQTGLGKTTPEGIFGLQRAFKMAGVNTILMTLWNIDDDATKYFMELFYKNLVNNGWDKRKAFNAARDGLRAVKKWEDPYYWAGFVLLDCVE